MVRTESGCILKGGDMSTKGVHKALVFVCALLLTIFVLPGVAAAAAPQKLYGLEFLLPATTLTGAPNPSYNSVTGQLVPPVEVAVKFKNESPPSVGTSNIASIKFVVSGVVITGVACPRGICSFDTSTNTVFVTNISPPVHATETFVVTLTVNSCVAAGDATVPLSSVVVSTGSQVDNGSPFSSYSKDASFPLVTTLSDPGKIFTDPNNAAAGISCGDIDCGESFSVANSFCTSSVAGDPDCLTTVRGLDTDGSCAASVDYFATNNLVTTKNEKLHFAWQTDSFAAFAYKVNIPSTTEPYLQLAWLPKNGPPIYIPAPYCKVLVPATALPTQLPLPSPYGTLDQDVKLNSSKIQVTLLPGVGPPAVGSAIVIGSERMIVTGIGSNSWSVQRGDGFTTKATHPAGANVMFTALPTLDQDYKGVPYAFTQQQTSAGYKVGLKAQMCLASPLLDNHDGTWSGWIIDSGDGYMNW